MIPRDPERGPLAEGVGLRPEDIARGLSAVRGGRGHWLSEPTPPAGTGAEDAGTTPATR